MTRFARVALGDRVSYAMVTADLQAEFLQGTPFGDYRLTGERHALADVRLLAPVQPPNILAIGLNYRAHAIESGAPIPERPVLFIKANTAVCGPDDPIMLPRIAPDEVDYECELAIVIGKTARHVSPATALDYVLGYTCANDVSARDCQLRLDGGQWSRGKSFDTFAPLGPWIETDLDPDNAEIMSRVNGREMQHSNTDDLIFDCRHIVAYLSEAMTLPPGTVIMTGTPSGVGFARKPPVFLRAGDVVEIEIAGIGVLRNPVIAA
ncbi:MAG: fumarylacetoacetate hydrolase family protein [Chloroflexi bacterium]|jgi:2-keto-4-pentenoate hydratase/2-oxohepta-3-ene-1,7-dioic acid hydratase in catechol pathway|nr:fumarylacetoacetate hydrolase family protein [Chloroflexota bacterium]